MTPEVLLVAIAGYGLNPSLRLFVEAPLDERAWRALVVELETRQLTALALAAAKAEVLPVTEEQAEDLRFRNAGALARRDAAVQCLTELIGVLNHYAIDSCVLCGAATAALDYQVADLRLYESANVLVPSGQHDQAVTVLQGKGMLQPSAQEPRPRRRRAINFCAANGVAIQLHFTIMPGRYGGTVQTRDLLASRVWFSRRGVRLGALGAEERLLHASIQARLNGTGGDLLAQRDVVQLVLRDDLALRRLERLASSWRLEAVLADAVRRAWDTFAVPDVVPISAWSRSYRPHRRDRRRLAARPPQTAFERGESWGDSGAMDVAPGTGF